MAVEADLQRCTLLCGSHLLRLRLPLLGNRLQSARRRLPLLCRCRCQAQPSRCRALALCAQGPCLRSVRLQVQLRRSASHRKRAGRPHLLLQVQALEVAWLPRATPAAAPVAPAPTRASLSASQLVRRRWSASALLQWLKPRRSCGRRELQRHAHELCLLRSLRRLAAALLLLLALLAFPHRCPRTASRRKQMPTAMMAALYLVRSALMASTPPLLLLPLLPLLMDCRLHGAAPRRHFSAAAAAAPTAAAPRIRTRTAACARAATSTSAQELQQVQVRGGGRPKKRMPQMPRTGTATASTASEQMTTAAIIMIMVLPLRFAAVPCFQVPCFQVPVPVPVLALALLASPAAPPWRKARVAVAVAADEAQPTRPSGRLAHLHLQVQVRIQIGRARAPVSTAPRLLLRLCAQRQGRQCSRLAPQASPPAPPTQVQLRRLQNCVLDAPPSSVSSRRAVAAVAVAVELLLGASCRHLPQDLLSLVRARHRHRHQHQHRAMMLPMRLRSCAPLSAGVTLATAALAELSPVQRRLRLGLRHL